LIARPKGLPMRDVRAPRRRGPGLTRPELAVLLSSASWPCRTRSKHSATARRSGVGGRSAGGLSAGDAQVTARISSSHRLRREIIATKLANRIVNRLGLIHPSNWSRKKARRWRRSPRRVRRGGTLFGMGKVWQALETAPMSEGARIMLFDRAAAALSDHIADLLRIGGHTCEPSKLVAELQGGVAELTPQSRKPAVPRSPCPIGPDAERLGRSWRARSRSRAGGPVARCRWINRDCSAGP
jgi:glutamate dehydrogenase